MDRKTFLKTCGFACFSTSVMGTILESCGTSKIHHVPISGQDLLVPLSYFEMEKNGQKEFKKYVIVHNESLQFPICVYRSNTTSYTALWMKCTHQGAELQVFGDKLQCPAHGSEFSNTGSPQNGPADEPLRTFLVTVDTDQLKIALK